MNCVRLLTAAVLMSLAFLPGKSSGAGPLDPKATFQETQWTISLGGRLGLLMVEALMVVEDVYPVLLGPQTPMDEIVRAAQLKQVDAVCLSFSSAYSPTLAAQGLRDLRQMLPAGIELWAGGYGVKAIRKPIEGVCLMPEFQDLYECLATWRTDHGCEPYKPAES